MYWPSVQDDSMSSPFLGGVACITKRLFCRPMSLDLEDPQNECPSGSLMQPFSAMIEPVTDTFRRRLWTWTPPFDQSALTSAVRHAAGFHRKHDQPDFRR